MRTFPATLALAAALAAPAPAVADGLEDMVLAELNFARTQPQAYARAALLAPVSYRGAHLDPREQDPQAFAEAVDFLMRQPPLPPLSPDDRIAQAALRHVREQGPTGGLGHSGPRGETPGRRLQDEGVWAGLSAEAISYGYDEARQVVLQLIVDPDVPGRGHRKTIFSGGYRLAGVACGAHAGYGHMCVIDFAGALARR